MALRRWSSVGALALASAFALLVPGLAPAGAQPVQSLSLGQGRSTTFETPGLTRVAVGDGRIAGVVPVGTEEVVVSAKAPGHTSIIIWDRSGRRDYDLTVTEQTLDDLARVVRAAIDIPGLTIEPVGAHALVVRGEVADATQRHKVADVLARFAVLARDQKYDFVDAVTVLHPLGDLAAALGPGIDAREIRVDEDDKGNVYVSGRVRDAAAEQTVLDRVRGYAGATLAANGKLIDRLVLETIQQVDTKVTILEVDRTGMQQLGIRLQSALVNSDGTVTYNNPSFPVYDAPGAAGQNGLSVGRFIRSTFIAPTLDLILQEGHARVLSSPNLVTMPGSNAKFLVGGEIPFIVPSGLGTVAVQFKQYGVLLDLTPTIMPDGSVETKLTPEVSDLDYADAITVAGYTVPSFKTSRITTDIVSRPGESIVMAGLLRRQEQKTIYKVPGLSSLPILGKLFQSTQYQKADTDVVFVMTPEVVTR